MNEHFDKGYRQAERVADKGSAEVAYWLVRAHHGRRRWRTRLFDWKKRRFLDGFISCLERHRENSASASTGSFDSGAARFE